MSNWRFADFLGRPEIWCFDLGNDISNIKFFDIPTDENQKPKYTGSYNFSVSGIYYLIACRPYTARMKGYVTILPCAPVSKSQFEIDKFGEEYFDLPDNIKPGDTINPKELRSGNNYKNVPISVQCNDPRLLALCNFVSDVIWGDVPYKKIKHIVNKLPSKEVAIEYMNLNGYVWDEPLTEQEYTQNLQNKKFSDMGHEPGNISPLLRGIR